MKRAVATSCDPPLVPNSALLVPTSANRHVPILPSRSYYPCSGVPPQNKTEASVVGRGTLSPGKCAGTRSAGCSLFFTLYAQPRNVKHKSYGPRGPCRLMTSLQSPAPTLVFVLSHIPS